jgi:uncharacterized protein (DUF927 family)
MMKDNLEDQTEQREVHTTLYGLNPPGPKDMQIPMGWYLNETGVHQYKYREDEKEVLKRVASTPVILTGRMKDLATEAEWLEIQWHREGRWQREIIERQTISNRNRIVSLSEKGFPVTSTNAKALVDYLAEFESLNLSFLPVEIVSTHLGWQDGGEKGFLLGKKHINGLSDLDIRFRPLNVGDAQISDAFTTKGSFKDWISCITPIQKYPKVLALFYASFAAPLLEILKAPNFIVDLSSGTSEGKTIALRIAASIWGNPDERDRDSILHSWDLTKVWVEKTSGVLQSLPLILDDTKTCKENKFVKETIYGVANGRGKGRGSVTGTQETAHWRTILLSTGESPATSFTQDGGAFARVLTLWGSPWEKKDDETGQMVNQVDAGIKANYGEAGLFFIRCLTYLKEKWPEWVEQFEKIRADYQRRAGGNSIAWRVADYFATIQMAAKIVHKQLGLSWTYDEAKEALNSLWKDVKSEAQNADRPKAALEFVFSYAQSHQYEFYGRDNGRTNWKGLAGRWDNDEDWSFIGFFPDRLKKVLQEEGFDLEGILRTWRDRRWLDTDKEKKTSRLKKKIKIGDETPRLIVINRAAFDKLEAPSENSTLENNDEKENIYRASLDLDTFGDKDIDDNQLTVGT